MKETLFGINLIFKTKSWPTVEVKKERSLPISIMNPFGEIPKCDDDLINIVSCFLIILSRPAKTDWRRINNS